MLNKSIDIPIVLMVDEDEPSDGKQLYFNSEKGILY